MMRIGISACVLVCLFSLGACSLAPQTRDLAAYDFGPAAPAKADPRITLNVTVAEVGAPLWMESSKLYYRLGYADAARPLAYANSRWVMPPAALLTQRLRAALQQASKAAIVSPADGVRTDYVLRLDLEEFSQVFDSAEKSRGVMRLQARLVRGRELAAQQGFTVDLPAPSANAEGGVRALSAAADETGRQLADWLAANMRR